MTASANISQLYEEIASITQQMLIATQHQDWDRLKELETHCAQFAEQMKACEMEAMSDADARSRIASIKAMLANDREMRNLMTPWMVRLDTIMYPGLERATHYR